MTSRPRAFTLIEMLVVVVLLTMTLAIVVRAVGKVEMTGRRTETITRLKAVAQALQRYRDDWGDVPPYNPTGADYDGNGNADPSGPGLWSLYMLDYLSNYRYLTDAASQVEVPWVTDPGGGDPLQVVPGDMNSMGLAYNAYYDPDIDPVGSDLTPEQEYRVYTLLARPADHDTPAASQSVAGAYDNYDEATYENYCSWMMQDPYSREWKYQPIRATVAPGGSGTETFPVADATKGQYYHRQLSHRWTDEDTPRYLPAVDTVVTWSSLFRQLDRRPWGSHPDWGTDLVLFADGRVLAVPGPEAAVDWSDEAQAALTARCLQRPVQ